MFTVNNIEEFFTFTGNLLKNKTYLEDILIALKI